VKTGIPSKVLKPTCLPGKETDVRSHAAVAEHNLISIRRRLRDTSDPGHPTGTADVDRASPIQPRHHQHVALAKPLGGFARCPELDGTRIAYRVLRRCNIQRGIVMNEDRVVGAAKNFGGKVEEGFGRVTGDTKRQAEGLADQAMGAAQNIYGQAKDSAADAAEVVKKGASNAEDFVRRVIERQPYTAVAVAFAIGLVLGWRGRKYD
jgi:uncharacterized protein YjbJ (UPF0337 family)